MNYGTMITGVSSSNIIDSLFSSTTRQQSQLDNLSSRALINGIDLSIKGDYDAAIKEFKRAIGLSPSSTNSAKAHEYMANAYLKQNKTKESIATYRQAIRFFPTDDAAHLQLGTLLFSKERYKEALEEYKMAVRLNPNSPATRFALGQTYLTTEDYIKAEDQFKRVTQLSPNDPNGYDALGQVYRQTGDYDKAVFQFNKALALNKDSSDSLLNLGYTYADMGESEKAQEQANILEKTESASAIMLRNYINEVSIPKISSAYTFGGFTPTAGRKTLVSSMNTSLSNPDASKQFTMRFNFSKEMDVYSVRNPYNWRISRATGKDVGGAYNWGLPIPETEVNIPAIPISVVYDENAKSADVSFRITQNSSGDGTIDPGHIVFKFSGIDAYGKAMDSSADEYGGFSKIV